MAAALASVRALEIDIDAWLGFVLAAGYLSCLTAAAIYIARPKASHLLVIEPPSPIGHRPLFAARGLMAATAILAWCGGLVAVETWIVGRFAPSLIEGLACAQRWLPPLSCELPGSPPIAGQRLALVALVAYGAIGSMVWLTAKDSALLPLAMLGLGFLAFGALADLVAAAPASARPGVLTGAIAAIQLTAAAALAFALIAMPSPRPVALLKLHTAYLAVLGLRLLALLSLLSLWTRAPPAMAVSTLLVLVLIPGVAGGAAIVAAGAREGR